MRHPLSLFIIALMTATTVVVGAVLLAHTPVQAQFGSDPEEMALQVYDKLPAFPRENQYIHRKKKQVVDDNTLVSRLIRYHTINHARSPQYRLDWKITLADYLGINEYISPENYPGANYLKENPFEQDQAIIQGLDRNERNKLIQAIVDTYDPGTQTAPALTAPPLLSPEPAEPAPAPQVAPVLPSNNATDLITPTPTPEPTKQDLEPQKTEPTGPAKLLLIDETP